MWIPFCSFRDAVLLELFKSFGAVKARLGGATGQVSALFRRILFPKSLYIFGSQFGFVDFPDSESAQVAKALHGQGSHCPPKHLVLTFAL
jgi:hypothetical protein